MKAASRNVGDAYVDLERRARRRVVWRERLISPSAGVLPGRRTASRRWAAGAVVLLYHRLVDGERSRDPFSVSRGAFERQVEWLSRAFTVVSAGELAARTQGDEELAGLAAITFDDGDRSLIEMAMPVLESYRAPATVFVDVGALMGRARAGLSADDIRSLTTAGVEVASHGVTHTDLTELSDEDVLEELVRSKQLLDATTGKSVTGFAYPYGSYDERVAALVPLAGYEFAYTCRQHRPVLPNDDPFRLCRVEITPSDDRPRFRAKLAGAYAHVYAAWYRINPAMRTWLD